MPTILYKYRSTGERTDAMLANQEVWLAKPETLNDPLDCRIEEIDRSALRTHRRQTMQAQLEGFVFHATTDLKSEHPFFNIEGQAIKGMLRNLKSKKSLKR